MIAEAGRVCLKNTGREAGSYCVVLKKINESFVEITGPKLLTGIKRRRCNVDHLNPTEYKIDINENSKEEEIIAAFEKAHLITKFKLKKPSAAQLKSEAATPKIEKKAEEKKETKKETKKESKNEETKSKK